MDRIFPFVYPVICTTPADGHTIEVCVYSTPEAAEALVKQYPDSYDEDLSEYYVYSIGIRRATMSDEIDKGPDVNFPYTEKRWSTNS